MSRKNATRYVLRDYQYDGLNSENKRKMRVSDINRKNLTQFLSKKEGPYFSTKTDIINSALNNASMRANARKLIDPNNSNVSKMFMREQNIAL